MTFLGAYKSFWKNYFNFKGRATRKEYWFVVLWNCIITLPLSIGLIAAVVSLVYWDLRATEVDFSSSGFIWTLILSVLLILYTLATFIPNLSLVIRRFHDVGLSGWWYVGLYILNLCLSFVSVLTGSERLEMMSLIISLIFSIGMFVVTVLPTDKLVKKTFKE